MDDPSSPKFVELAVETRQDLDRILDSAIEQLMPTAMAELAGIQVVRSGVGAYTVSVRPDIPFGTIIESWEPRQATAGINLEPARA